MPRSGRTAPPLVKTVYAVATSNGVSSKTPSVIDGKPRGGWPTPTRRQNDDTVLKPTVSPTWTVPTLRDIASARRHVISPSYSPP